MRRLVGLVLALGSLIGFSLATNTESSYETCFRNAVNFERASRGIPSLKDDPKLDMLASTHSDQMAAAGTIYHNDQLGQQAVGYRYVGENVGMGPSCESIHAAFMASKGHRENILDDDYRRLGVGVTVDKNPDSSTGVTVYVTEVFGSTPSSPKPPAPPKPAPKPKPVCTCPG